MTSVGRLHIFMSAVTFTSPRNLVLLVFDSVEKMLLIVMRKKSGASFMTSCVACGLPCRRELCARVKLQN